MMAAGLFCMVMINFINVVCRYLLPQTPFSFSEELLLLLFIWVVMFGISCGYKRRAHTGLTLLTDLLPPAWKKVCVLAASVCSGVLMAIILWSGSLLVWNQLRFGNTLPGLKISAAWAGMAIPVGAVVIFFRIVQTGMKALRKPDSGGNA